MDDIFEDEDYMLWRLFTQARNAIHKLRNKELLRYGLTSRKAAILLILQAVKNNDINSYKIAKWLILEHHSVSELINRMEKEGLVNKVQNQDNRGSIRIRLTVKGMKAAEQAGKAESFHQVMAILSDKEREHFVSTLKRLRNNALRELRITNRLPYPPF